MSAAYIGFPAYSPAVDRVGTWLIQGELVVILWLLIKGARRSAALVLLCACAPSTAVPHPGRPPAQEPPDRDRPLLMADTTGLPPGAPLADLTRSATRDSLRAAIRTRRAAWRALAVADYNMLVRTACFCPGGGGGWHTLEVRAGATNRVWDARGALVPTGEWAGYSIDRLFDLLEQAVDRNDGMGVRWDDRWHVPASVSIDYRRGLPDDWGIIQVAGFTEAVRR